MNASRNDASGDVIKLADEEPSAPQLNSTAVCSISITNADSWKCGASKFDLSVAEWKENGKSRGVAVDDIVAEFERTSVYLAPGRSAQTGVTITYIGNESARSSVALVAHISGKRGLDDVSEHSMNASLPVVAAGYCRLSPPVITLVDDSLAQLSMFPRQKVTLEFEVRNENSVHCYPSTFKIGFGEYYLSNIFTSSFSARKFDIPSQSQKVIIITFTRIITY